MMTPPQETPPRFDDASRTVVGYLRDALPIGTWTVTRFDGQRQIYLTVDDTDLGVRAGDHIEWTDSFCQYSTRGLTPQIAPDIRVVPEYVAVIDRTGASVASYVSHPLVTADGGLFGTLCGFGRDPISDDARDQEALIGLLAALLSQIIDSDLHATRIERSLEAAQREAHTDVLTGLLNRNGWERLLSAEDPRFTRFGDPGAVVVIDLDHLKGINDAHGHHAGDLLLRTAARSIRDAVDLPATISRVGGDEFAVLVFGAADPLVWALQRRLRDALTEAGVQASMGLALCATAGGLERAWRAADAAMYAEKTAKRRRTCDGDRDAPVV